MNIISNSFKSENHSVLEVVLLLQNVSYQQKCAVVSVIIIFLNKPEVKMFYVTVFFKLGPPLVICPLLLRAPS